MPQVTSEQYHIVIVMFISLKIKKRRQEAGNLDNNERENGDENEENVLKSDNAECKYGLTC